MSLETAMEWLKRPAGPDSFQRKMAYIDSTIDTMQEHFLQRQQEENRRFDEIHKTVPRSQEIETINISNRDIFPEIYQELLDEGMSDEEIDEELEAFSRELANAEEQERFLDDFGQDQGGKIDTHPWEFSELFMQHQIFNLSQVLQIYAILERHLLDHVNYFCSLKKVDLAQRIRCFRDEKKKMPELEKILMLSGLNLDAHYQQLIFTLRNLRNQFTHNLDSLDYQDDLSRVERLKHQVKYFPGAILKKNRIYLTRDFLKNYINVALDVYGHVKEMAFPKRM